MNPPNKTTDLELSLSGRRFPEGTLGTDVGSEEGEDDLQVPGTHVPPVGSYRP